MYSAIQSSVEWNKRRARTLDSLETNAYRRRLRMVPTEEATHPHTASVASARYKLHVSFFYVEREVSGRTLILDSGDSRLNQIVTAVDQYLSNPIGCENRSESRYYNTYR